MAAFTDQFQRYDPKTFDGANCGPLSTAIALMAADAQEYLGEVITTAEMTQYCAAASEELSKRVSCPPDIKDREIGEAAALHDVLMGLAPGLISDGRERLTGWTPYASLALWKLIDASDAARQLQVDSTPSELAVNNLMLASKALQICASIVARDAERLREYEFQEAKKSEDARNRVRHRWGDRDIHRDYVISSCQSLQADFYIDAAKRLADMVEEEFGRRYDDGTVLGWLKEAGWKPAGK
ncbi:hypothetical protein [Rhodoferax mekongensis]|uniref:hypothetical protein n=1 Tax=Rhodoferax mekongensis TaxID=3068341 RepID=UPI0028BD39B3|nr:hypothetical protein [Rhodoferax sp. TBRC 17199]MDT7514700.1 hypothetical protein [Rhodoferax sp. TBRC 17199]